MSDLAHAEQIADEGYTHFQMGDMREARLLYEEALVLAPEDPDVLRVYAQILYRLGENDDAEEQMKKAGSFAKSEGKKVQCLSDLAALYFYLGKLEDSLAVALEAEQLDATHPSVATTLMDIAAAQGDRQSAGEWLDKARERYRSKGTRAGGGPLGPGEPEKFLKPADRRPIVNIVVYKSGTHPPHEIAYIKQMCLAIRLSLSDIKDAQLEIRYVEMSDLQPSFIQGATLARGWLESDTLKWTPFVDPSGEPGIVLQRHVSGDSGSSGCLGALLLAFALVVLFVGVVLKGIG